MFRQKILALFVCLIGSGSVCAQAPAIPTAPSNLRVRPLGVNSFQLNWKDNSNNEKGWEIRVSLGKTDSPARFQLVPTANLTSYVVITNDLPGQTLSFQLTAYNGETDSEQFSKPTSVVTVVALGTTPFDSPSDFTATPIDDGRIRIGWKDKTSSEHGYQVQYKKGSGDWVDYTVMNPGVNFSLAAGIFEPSTQYSFRSRAFRNNPVVFTAYSNIATATTKPFQAPDTLVVRPSGEGAVKLKWKDRSSIESGFELEWKTGTDAYKSLGDANSNTVSTDAISGFSLNTSYQFRVRGFRIIDSKRVYSGYTNVASAKTTPLAKPTDFAGQVLGETYLRLTWKDASAFENGFKIESRKLGATEFKELDAELGANSKEYIVTGLVPGTTYEFRARAYGQTFFTSFSSAYTPVIQLTTLDGIASDLNPPIFWNTSFLHTISISRLSQLSSLVLIGSLPAGLTYNSSTRTISGTTTFEGVKTVSLKATFKTGRVVTRPFTLRVIRPPAAPVVTAAVLAPVQVAVGASSSVSVVGKFSDPDAPDARRVTTSLGNFDIILYSLATPGTVTNFLKYANAGRFNGTFFHRSVGDFIIQGGGYQYDSTAGFKKVITYPAILNEPGISNLAGTVAMAKIGGNPNSATSEFFVNVDDTNAANLDYQNEGFSVFGRVAGSGMTVVNQINALPRKDYTLTVDGTSRALTDVPMNVTVAPASMDPTKLVTVTSVAPVAVLRYEVLSSNPAVATATVAGNDVSITGVATGSTSIEVKAIDLDGNPVTRTIQVTVP